jgi:hypothetical protein
MPRTECRYFIVKHDLESLEQFPELIWRAKRRKGEQPRGYGSVRKGDRWIAFAYTDAWGAGQNALSLVTGFYECTEEAEFQRLPPSDADRRRWKCRGALYQSRLERLTEFARRPGVWLIVGEPYGDRLDEPIGVPPISRLLEGRSVFNQATLIPIDANEFKHIRKQVLDLRRFDASTIPLIGREPRCEQELLAVVVHGHVDLGIAQIHRVRKAFPDLLVQIEGGPKEVHLELELYSSGFFAHEHDRWVRQGRFKGDDKPVAVLCWIDDAPRLKSKVERVYELRTLLRKGKKIRWQSGGATVLSWPSGDLT